VTHFASPGCLWTSLVEVTQTKFAKYCHSVATQLIFLDLFTDSTDAGYS